MRRVIGRSALSICAAVLGALSSPMSAGCPTPDAGPGAGDAVAAVPIDGRSLGGYVLPTLPVETDLRLEAVQAWSWTVDDTTRLYLKGDVQVIAGAYNFAAEEVVVWIDRIPSADGLINQFAFYFPMTDEPTRRAGLAAGGRNLLVTGAARGNIQLDVVERRDSPPPRNATVTKGEARLARYLQRLESNPPALALRPTLEATTIAPEPPLEVGGSVRQAVDDAISSGGTATASADPIFTPDGVLSFFGENIEIDEAGDAVTVMGGVAVEYRSLQRERELQLTAERAVIFLKPGTIQSLRERSGLIDAGQVIGIYLEGGVVATDFEYTMRGNRVYYDLPLNRAVVLDAVLRTHLRNGQPVVARAREIQQISADEWRATHASVSLSQFFEPHLSMGVERLRVERQADGGSLVEAEDVTLRAQGAPIMWWPRMAGSPEKIPLKSLQMGFANSTGVAVKSEWDILDLLGLDSPPGTELSLLQEAYTSNGIGFGARLTSTGDGTGHLEGLGFSDFGNPELTSSGRTITSSESARGYLLGDWTNRLSPDLLFQADLSWISDNTFINTFRWDDFAERREYTSSARLSIESGHTMLTLLGKYNLNDFVSNSAMLAARPYSVDKAPELSYGRYGDSLFGDSITWSSEYSATMMRLKATSGTPDQLGISPLAFSPLMTGTDSVNTEYYAAGYDSDFHGRLYTRQELASPISFRGGAITPFVTGTATGYITNFQDYSTQAESLRCLLSGGVRASAEFSQELADFTSTMFDLHRLRHLVQPYGTLWYGWDSGTPLGQPVYDQEVEAISGAAAAQIGITQKLQTMRGGPGAWRSVDFATLDLSAAFDSNGNSFQANNSSLPASLRYAQSPAPQFYSWRPEYSQWGDHLAARLLLEASDAMSIYGSGTYLLQSDRENSINSFGLDGLARGTIGTSVRQSPDVTTFLEYRYVNTFDPTGTYPADEFLQAGFTYQVSKTYLITVAPQWDLIASDFRAISGSLTREFPDFDLRFSGSYDSIVDEAFFGLSIRLHGVGDEAQALSDSSATFGAFGPGGS